MLPSFKSSSPEIILKSVDFPHPEGPTKTTNSPSKCYRGHRYSFTPPVESPEIKNFSK